MRKIFIVLFCFLLCIQPVFADSDVKIATPGAIYYEYPTDILELLMSRSSLPANAIEGELVNVEKSTMRVSANDATGFKAVLLSLLGDYETVVTDYTYQNGSYYSHSIQIERDWAWICGAAIFGLVIFCVFRFIGGLFCR